VRNCTGHIGLSYTIINGYVKASCAVFLNMYYNAFNAAIIVFPNFYHCATLAGVDLGFLERGVNSRY